MGRLATRFRSAEDSPGFLLWKAANLLQRLHADCLRGLQVTPTQFSLLTCLVFLHQDGPVTAAGIVNHTGMDKMMVSDLVKTLERKQLLRRRANPEDGRSWLIAPTASGVRTTNIAIGKVESVDTKFFARVRNAASFRANLRALVSDSDGSSSRVSVRRASRRV